MIAHPGAGRGIGQQIAKHFALAGAAAIAVADITLKNLEETVELVKQAGSKAFPFACDVSKEEQVVKFIESAVAQVGDIDVLVNVAGVCNAKPIFFETFSSIWRDIEINLGGVCSTGFVPTHSDLY